MVEHIVVSSDGSFLTLGFFFPQYLQLHFNGYFYTCDHAFTRVFVCTR